VNVAPKHNNPLVAVPPLSTPDPPEDAAPTHPKPPPAMLTSLAQRTPHLAASRRF